MQTHCVSQENLNGDKTLKKWLISILKDEPGPVLAFNTDISYFF